MAVILIMFRKDNLILPIAILYQDITGIDIFVSVSYEITLLEEMFILGKAGYSCRTAPLRWRY